MAGDSEPLEEFADSLETAAWRRAKALIGLAPIKGTAYSLERLRELVNSQETPNSQKIELAAALIQWHDDETGLTTLRELADEPNYFRPVLRKFFEMGRVLEIEAIAAECSREGGGVDFAVRALKAIGALESLQRLSISSNSSTIQAAAKKAIEEVEEM